MKMMHTMMKPVIGRMSIEDKQEMMLKMMPMMMKDVNMIDTMLKMVPEMLDQISMLDLLEALKKLFPTMLQGVNVAAELAPKLAGMMPALMEKMMPMMEVMMPSMMGKMMPVMMTEENMARMETFPDRLLSKMLTDEDVRVLMPEMMSRMIPKCLKQMLPCLPEDKRAEFVARMKYILEEG